MLKETPKVIGVHFVRMRKLYRSEECIEVPTPCPLCGGRMYAIQYHAPLKILKQRSFLECGVCDFAETADDFKKRLLTV